MSDTAPIDIGHGMTAALRLAEFFGSSLNIPDGTPIGVLLTHPCSARDGSVVQDFIPIEPYPAPGGPWTLESREPITLSPSVSYTCCGLHGFVREGKWVQA